ncbi:GntR family transcriptional regulator [Treponema phagedenis]|uniref:FCD domain protein n=1 Tax=Treponema phagedenis TaxID=162 RepID=A0A0B7GVW6_TREPH|nr:GntR family transcriptional regulator [Treponema phagedenis]NVP25485.1 GntR family transcriptional regulator [Treponema phagedenis]QEJ93962.1 GntR family transcriptional regulator [Treponema phagedenis]QEJ96716.1 GntR family transcriptional regulator [Treponema phagedenis]QEJ96876.1 GntR family transcriptional regulator [Treponema phagedenis]QEK02030.1 GntR family transcriptional regulator [Treponema phagedenis]
MNTKKNKRAVVLGLNEKYISDHYDLRAILEGEACYLTVINKGSLEKLINSYEAAKAEIAKKNFSDYSNYNYAFHLEIWKLAKNDKLITTLKDLWNGLSVNKIMSNAEYAKMSMKEHKEILDALIAENGELARDLMRQHLYRSKESILTHYR